MKTLTVGEAQGQLAKLIAEAHKGAVIVLTDGRQAGLARHEQTVGFGDGQPGTRGRIGQGRRGTVYTIFAARDAIHRGTHHHKEKRGK